ncbi:MAG: DUF1501 domain-containing protein [Cyclobacteriaceae bacterium]|nr:DUF1501 domain-containing protein [Cyclobacteriaceae bacterium]MCH8515994.1 DUF1501 domain-containing protein [Cyclobacteriaceae bacterium]
MNRRKFLKGLSATAAAPLLLGGVPFSIPSFAAPLSRLSGFSDNDRVLIILQLHGGNDGINTLIPLSNYDHYYSRRANIALPYRNGNRRIIELDSTVADADKAGLHPDMKALKSIYDEGFMKVIQAVAYPNTNGSHFRGRDIWFMGGGANDYFDSGWIGRYLKSRIPTGLSYPDDFPNADMKDPLAIELGNETSLIFHQSDNIPVSLSLGGSPEGFANNVDTLDGFQDRGIDIKGQPPEHISQTQYGEELNWILGLEDKTEDYAARLREVYQRAPETRADYPEVYPLTSSPGSRRNPLSDQFKLIAKLLDGGGQGVKTKVFMARIGGFDTHAQQTVGYDPTMGTHAALLYHISTALAAFQEDLRQRGLEQRVLTVTSSEFGRRIHSNGSFGTDHGTGAPMFVIGRGVQGGLLGTNPDLSKNNIDMQYDYRQVYSHILRDWMLVDEQTIRNDVFFGNFLDGPNPQGGFFEDIELIRDQITSTKNQTAIDQLQVFPNPANIYTTINFVCAYSQHINISINDTKGNMVMPLFSEFYHAGKHQKTINVQALPPGVYMIRWQSEDFQIVKKLIIRT